MRGSWRRSWLDDRRRNVRSAVQSMLRIDRFMLDADAELQEVRLEGLISAGNRKRERVSLRQ
jgi:hypothetical protein